METCNVVINLCNKLRVLRQALLGYGYRFLVDLHLVKIPSLETTNCDVVVSLTSYGRRVKKQVVYYTIVSLLRQTMQPKRIILWLSESEWNDNTIPQRLLKLRNKGVEIRYCKEIRSYKKLIPTITLCPNDNIMTVDDDIIYATDTLSSIWQSHRLNLNAIKCFSASRPIVKNGIPSSYASWRELNVSDKGLLIFPIGYGGTLYPCGSLHVDVTREDLFMQLCPLADDIWFWFCGLLNNTEKVFVPKSSFDLSFDALYQYFHKGSALTHSNRFENANDVQFKSLFEYYNVSVCENGNLTYKQK